MLYVFSFKLFEMNVVSTATAPNLEPSSENMIYVTLHPFAQADQVKVKVANGNKGESGK